MTEPAPSADAVQERLGPPPPTVPDVLPYESTAAPPDGDYSLRSSSLHVKLALLERGHAAAAKSRFRRRILMILALVASLGAGAAIGGISGAGLHELLYERAPRPTAVAVRDEKGKYHYFIDD